MKQFGELFQSADWKTEKHVPAIDCADKVKSGEFFPVKVTIGKEIAHPNTTEHHIRWISVYFQGEGDKFPFEIGRFDFTAHGESAEGPNKGPVYTHHEVSLSMKTSKPGIIYASSLCNIHGLWKSEKEIKIS
ncbi:MAG: class II SORL domain-containing protein [Chloroflexota bacterium]